MPDVGSRKGERIALANEIWKVRWTIDAAGMAAEGVPGAGYGNVGGNAEPVPRASRSQENPDCELYHAVGLGGTLGPCLHQQHPLWRFRNPPRRRRFSAGD